MRYKHFYTSFVVVFIFIILSRCTSSKPPYISSQQKDNIQQEGMYAIRNVNIIPMTTENKVIKNATIFIKDKRIFSINKPIPTNVKIIDGSGEWLIPRLIDMHVHNLADINFGSNYPTKGATLFTNTQDFMSLYVANGVTTVFELSARVEHFAQRNEIINGKVIGPRIALAILVEGGDASGNVANTPSDGRQTVRIAKAQGYEFIKVYSRLNIETYKGQRKRNLANTNIDNNGEDCSPSPFS